MTTCGLTVYTKMLPIFCIIASDDPNETYHSRKQFDLWLNDSMIGDTFLDMKEKDN